MVLAWFSCTTFMLNFNRVFFLLYWKFFLNQIIFLIFYILLSLCLFHEFQLDSHKNSDMFMTWFKDTFSLIRSFFVDVFVWKWNFIFFWGSSLVWVFECLSLLFLFHFIDLIRVDYLFLTINLELSSTNTGRFSIWFW